MKETGFSLFLVFVLTLLSTRAIAEADMTPAIGNNYTISVGEKAAKLTAVEQSSEGAANNAAWYLLVQKRNYDSNMLSEGYETPVYDTGEGNALMRASTSVYPAALEGKFISDTRQYLLRFISTGSDGLYNIQFATGQYISASLTSSATPGTFAVYNISDTEGHFAINLGSTTGSIVDNNGAGHKIAFWDSGQVTDTGGNNDWYIYPVTLNEVAETLTTITWNIKDNDGNIVATQTLTNCKEGETYSTTLQYDYTTLSGNTTVTAGSEDQTIDLSYTVSGLPFETTSSYDATEHWYQLKNKGAFYMVYQAGETQYALTTEATDDDAYAWAFIGDPVKGFRIINKAAGKGQNLYIASPGNGGYPTLSTTTQRWSITQSTYKSGSYDFSDGGFGLSINGYYLNNYQNKNYLSLWQDSPSADAGSNFQVIEVEVKEEVEENVEDNSQATEKTLTYIYKYGDTEWYRETHTATIGEEFPLVHAQPAGVRYESIPTGNVATTTATTIEIPCQLTGAGTITHFSDSYDNAQWVFLAISSNYHLQYVSGQSYVTVNTGQTTRPAASNYAYQWAFVGNPFTGYKIINRAAGSGMILSSPVVDTDTNTGGSTFPIMKEESTITDDSYNTYWNIVANGLGVNIAREGESVYMNNRNGKLAYWTSRDGGSLFSMERVDLSLTEATIDTDKNYILVNRQTGDALAQGSVTDAWNSSSTYDVVKMVDEADEDLAQQWTLTAVDGGGYTLKNVGSNKYMGATGTSIWFYWYASYNCPQMADEAVSYHITQADDGYYYLTTSLSTAEGTTERLALNDGGTAPVPWTTWLQNAQWKLVEAKTPYTPATAITSGNYYRLHNYSYTTRSMSEVNNTVQGLANQDESMNQVWQLTASGSNYTFQNLWTGNYIQASSGWSTAYTTASTSGATMKATTGTDSDGNTYFMFAPNATSYYLHCASSQSYYVVSWWDSSSEPSRWYLEEVTLTQDDLNNIATQQQLCNTDYTDQLTTYFDDYACTSLKSAYASLSDDDLRTSMSALPSELQEMAIRVKNDTWNDNTTYNNYEKGFRIHDYEIYTNCNWKAITHVGPFAMLYNPSGITVSAGTLFYVFVNADAAASNAELLLHIVSDTNRYADQTVTLHRGYNAIMASSEGEVFIDYTLNNAENGTWDGTVCSSYPDIKVHIEGGNCTGTWDLHRGMTNNDWAWLKDNMFGYEFLHVKGESTLLNVVTNLVTDASRPAEILKAWDFVFDTEESLTGCDQWRKTGAYRPLINSRYSYSGNPNWDGGHGTNHPGLTASSIFNYENLYNTGTHGGSLWVISHEEGHAHQYPFELAGTTEQTNNSLANCVNLLWNLRETTLTKRSDRHDGVKGLLERFNNYPFSWIDYAGQRDVSDGYSSLWIANKWFYQLWLYFDFLGNYQPEGGNTGFSFTSALCDKLRADGIKYGYSSSSPGLATNDYLKLAKYAAEVAQADLSEYFQVWGFWQNAPAVSNESDLTDENTYYIGDYGSYWLQTEADAVTEVKTAMQQYSTKLSNIMFLEGRGSVDDDWLTYDNSTSTSFGETGWYKTFMNGITEAYDYTLSDNTVTMTGGKGAVGFKIYDADGNLVCASNFNSFTVSDAVAAGLTDGTYTLVAAQGDGTDYKMGECGSTLTVGSVTRIIDNALKGTATYEDILNKCREVLNAK